MAVVAMKAKGWRLLLHSLILLVLLTGSLSVDGTVFAEQGVQLSVTAGINGEYREFNMIPVRVTVTNGGTNDVEGNVMVAAGAGEEMLTVAYYQPVSVAKGSTKQVTIMVPGEEIGPNSYVIMQQDGVTIAKTNLGGRRYSRDALMVGVLAADPDTANFLATMPKSKYAEMVNVSPMKPEQVPTTAAQLSLIDMLIINNFALDSLTDAQVQAIKDWTSRGGMLMLAGGAQYGKTAGALAELSPVQVSGVASIQSLASLKVDKEKPVSLQAPFTVSQGTWKDGKVLVQEGNVPLFAVHSVGEGKALYVAYDLAEEPLASWSGNSHFWADLLHKAYGSTLNKTNMHPADSIWPLSEAADRIPALQLPQVPWLALLFVVYAFVVGPVLYLILRRKRKQSWMWALVPALAVVTGVGIFLYGAIQRGSGVIVNSAGMIQFQSSGQAKALEVATVFVPRSDDYEVEVKKSDRVWPLSNNRRWDEQPKVWLSMVEERANALFRDVEFWSVRKLGISKTIADAGTFVSDLSYANGKLSGTVTNKTAYTLRDVKIVSGRDVQDVAELAPGASAKVEISFDTKGQNMPNIRMASNRALLPTALQTNFPNQDSRESIMLDMLDSGGRYNQKDSASVMLLGWTNQPAAELEVKGETVRPDHLTLVTAPLSIKPSPDGTVFYPSGTFEAMLSDSTGNMDEVENGYQMEAGEATFEFQLDDPKQELLVSKVYLYTWSEDKTSFDKQVYNWQKKTYEPFDQAFVNTELSGEKLARYLSPEGILRVKFSHGMTEYRHLGMPLISVEGKVVKP
ncbi:MAG: hypothetical protein ACM32O_01930 [Clostridia bacterium]